MADYSKLIGCLETMKDSTLKNYVIAGLNSSIISKGTVRYFENTREHQDQITPHSHRFDFTCLVLEGYVVNRIWHESNASNSAKCDEFQKSMLQYSGAVGSHTVSPCFVGWFYSTEHLYHAGACYSMTANQIHSITLSKGAKVLFFEEPTDRTWSHIIEPWVNGKVIRTYETKDYMFIKEDQ